MSLQTEDHDLVFDFFVCFTGSSRFIGYVFIVWYFNYQTQICNSRAHLSESKIKYDCYVCTWDRSNGSMNFSFLCWLMYKRQFHKNGSFDVLTK